MTLALTICILVLFTIYFFIRKKVQKQRFSRAVDMTVNYMFQERPGQYSGDRNSKGGVFVFKAERNDEKLKNIVIRKVRPLYAALDVNLEQILVIPFEQKEKSKSNVSVRFKVIRKKALNEDLKGKRVSISGVLHFEKSRQERFTAVLPVTDLYQNLEI